MTPGRQPINAYVHPLSKQMMEKVGNLFDQLSSGGISEA